MTMADILKSDELPKGFEYPHQFHRVVDLGLTNLEPWWIFDGQLLRERLAGLRRRYPDRNLVPFARREDNDDVACWDVSRRSVVVIHDFASSGNEQRLELPDFNAWFRMAVDDFLQHDE
jgi:hypothetical protein